LASVIRLLHSDSVSSRVSQSWTPLFWAISRSHRLHCRLLCTLWETEANPQLARSVAILTELCFPARRFLN
jgi:hypothetical protein